MQVTNYLKAVTTNERFGKQHRDRNNSEFSESNQALLYQLKSASTAKSNLNDIAAEIKQPQTRMKKGATVNLRKIATAESYDPVREMKKLHSKEMRNQDKFRASNCILMCKNTAVKDQAELYTLIKRRTNTTLGTQKLTENLNSLEHQLS